jgi:ribonuclease HI
MSPVVYTDGACRGNPGPGGWAWAIDADHHDSGSARHTTNQRMELRAVMEAVRAHSGELTICSDSTYVVNCFRDRWYDGWLRRGWKNSKREPVANRDLWEPLLDLVLPRLDEIRWTWVKGHSGDVMNDLVDRLAVEASYAVDATAGVDLPG